MTEKNELLELSELGKTVEYSTQYDPSKLFPIPRKNKRDEIGIAGTLPFYGFDLWNHYEVSWLNEKGKPVVAIAEIIYSCETPNIVESKSLKLYFNSFNNTKIKDEATLQKIIVKDISERVGGDVTVKIIPLNHYKNGIYFAEMQGTLLDELDVTCNEYTVDTAYLKTENETVEEILFSNLLKSNCLVTNQPDWATVQIAYKGKKINHESLLQYLVSFRNHNEFHEQCIERIFVDIMKHCKPTELTVYGRYTRRGGLDINPYRSTHKNFPIQNDRLCRQ